MIFLLMCQCRFSVLKIFTVTLQLFRPYSMDYRALEASWMSQANFLFQDGGMSMEETGVKDTKELRNTVRNLYHRRMKKSLLSTVDFENFKKELEEISSVWEKEIKERKFKKFQRDIQDVQFDRVYKWKPSAQQARQCASSLSSYASTDGESGSRSRPRYPKRKLGPHQRPFGKRRMEERMAKQTSTLKVINLSNVPLTTEETEVLSLGLTFSPTSFFDCFTAVSDLNLFSRKVI